MITEFITYLTILELDIEWNILREIECVSNKKKDEK